MATQALSEAVRVTPAVPGAGLTLFGIPCPTWLTLLTIAYTIFLLIDKLPVVIERLKQFAAWLKGLNNGKSN